MLYKCKNNFLIKKMNVLCNCIIELFVNVLIQECVKICV